MTSILYDPVTDPLHPYLFAPVSCIPIEPKQIATRCHNVMRLDNIVYIGDVVSQTEVQWLMKPNFSRVSLIALKFALSRLGLSLGMDISEWPPNEKRIAEVQSECLARGLWDFDDLAKLQDELAKRQIAIHNTDHAETMAALHAIEHEMSLIKGRLANLRKDISVIRYNLSVKQALSNSIEKD
jgi:hypothetical protein